MTPNVQLAKAAEGARDRAEQVGAMAEHVKRIDDHLDRIGRQIDQALALATHRPEQRSTSKP